MWYITKKDEQMFQSTLPRRERPKQLSFRQMIMKFQSTLPRRERRCISGSSVSKIMVSIHAPTKGATPKAAHRRATLQVSIHAPTKGATGSFGYLVLIIGCFNPRSHEGSDVSPVILSLLTLCFNPRSHEGSDVINQHRETACFHVSIHAPTKGATLSLIIL